MKSRKTLIVTAAMALGGLILLAFLISPRQKNNGTKDGRREIGHLIIDNAHLVPRGDIPAFEANLNWIYDESDVDVRLIFLRDLGGRPIEQVADEQVKELNIGRRSGDNRGVLVLFDLAGQRLRIEVGYGLEAYLPDAFVDYLIRDHTREFFASGNISVGLRLLLRLLHHRIREAILGRAFDPSVLRILPTGRFSSGGAGASRLTPLERNTTAAMSETLTIRERTQFGPQESPASSYHKYLEWLSFGRFDPRISLFLPESQQYMKSLPMSKAYFDYILLQEYGRQFKTEIRGALALLYCTDDPLVSPHFFVKTGSGWQMDILAEVTNTTNRVGGPYVWDYRGQNDRYTKVFADKLVRLKGYIRIADGDNRMLPTRYQSGKLEGSTR